MLGEANSLSINGLARALIQANRVPEEKMRALCLDVSQKSGSFVAQLLDSCAFSAYDLACFAANTFSYPLLDLDAFDDSHLPVGVLEKKLMSTFKVLPLYQRGNRIAVGMADPSDLKALEAIRFQTNLLVDPIVVEWPKLLPLVEKFSVSTEDSLKNLASEDIDLEFSDDVPSYPVADVASTEIDDAPVVRFIQKMLLDAINDGASDIHFEPYEKSYRIRFRIDGDLHEIATPPLVIKDKIASRIKVISRLNIAEKRVPQDGRMKLVLSKNRVIDFRVSTLPTLHGEKIVLRILDPASATLGIDALGYDADQQALLLEAIHRPYGMVLVTGPTGSGKTVSLYTCLSLLNKPGVNISTVEDPAEIPLMGINQVNVDDKAGLTFPLALKSFLRQDPDIIMVGEIRDLETAEIAVKAAQTGHMVLSTLHTNDAPQTLTRLSNMGVPLFNIASSVLLITAQRLARRLCSCKVPLDVPAESLLNAGYTEADIEVDGGWTLYQPQGCERCKGSGYKGRVGIYQVMPVSEAMQRIILAGGSSLDVATQATHEGVKDLRRSGLLKAMQGITSLEEVLATTNS